MNRVNLGDKLLEAAQNGELEVVESLLKSGVDVNFQNNRGWTALTIAAFHQRLNLVKFLVENGANVNHVNVNGTSVLMYAKTKIVNTRDYKVVDFLLDTGADINIRDRKRNWTIIDYLGEIDDNELIEHIKQKEGT